jgi:hypothetical protein
MTAAFPSAFAAMIDARTKPYCPACKTRRDEADMDVSKFRRAHINAMREHYGAPCCFACTDAHRMSLDGYLCAPGAGVEDIDGGLWSSESALAEAEAEWAAEFSDRKAMRSWTR